MVNGSILNVSILNSSLLVWNVSVIQLLPKKVRMEEVHGLSRVILPKNSCFQICKSGNIGRGSQPFNPFVKSHEFPVHFLLQRFNYIFLLFFYNWHFNPEPLYFFMNSFLKGQNIFHFPGGSDDKESACNARHPASIHG